MRVATFNVRHGLPPRRREVDHDLLGRSVARLGADVVALQELDRSTDRSGGVDQVRVVAAATGSEVRFARAIRFGGGEYGNALVVRGGIVRATEVPLPSAVGEDRVALVAQVLHGAERWWVAATHLQNRRRGLPSEAPGQLRSVLDALDRSAGPSGPAVLLGDLNLGPDEVEPALAERGYAAAIGPPTFPAHRPREHIDWIAVRGATVVGVEVPDLRASDHRPLVAELRRADLHMDATADRPYG